MRLSEQQLKELQSILHKEFGSELTASQTNQAGIAIMRFVLAKYRRESTTNFKESKNGNNIKQQPAQ